jgi:hypothetical protein
MPPGRSDILKYVSLSFSPIVWKISTGPVVHKRPVFLDSLPEIQFFNSASYSNNWDIAGADNLLVIFRYCPVVLMLNG